jgi:phosphatidylinositol dimannoside acyltransferase
MAFARAASGPLAVEGIPAPAADHPTRAQRLQLRAYVAAESMAARLSPKVARTVAARLGDVALTIAPHRFDGLRANLRHVLPDASEAELDRTLRANVRNLARGWAEVMAMPSHGDEMAARVHPVNVENMVGPLERGRGAVVASPHFGSWEVGLACWNHRFGSMAVLAEILRPQEFFDRVVAGRARLGIDVIPIDTAGMRGADPATARRLGAAALRDVIRTLRSNGLVAMAMDRDLVGNGEPLDFFGAPAPIPVGVVDVAIRTGAAIVPVFLIRAGDQVIAPCFPEITYDAQAPREAEVRRVCAEVLRIFESVIREHPDQWHVLDPIWADA